MTSKLLAMTTGAVLLAGSAALYAMSVKVDGSGEGTGQAGRSMSPAAPAAFSVVVTSRRSTPGHSFSWNRSRQGAHSTASKSAPTNDHGWGEVAPDPRR